MIATKTKPKLVHKPPFPWFGGKSRCAHLVWERFGDVPNYVEPFAGSLAVLLNRPHEPRMETVNDLDCYLANFWRATQADPEAVAAHCDWPINEADLHARHTWLSAQADFRERMHADADYYDAKIAGWWVWGQCQWIGGGWCDSGSFLGRDRNQRPHLGRGKGVHRPSQKLPHLDGWGHGRGVQSGDRRKDLPAYFAALADRLRPVRVCCGDWTRVLGPCPTRSLGVTGVFLDPPYGPSRDARCYAVDEDGVYKRVAAWAREHGDDPKLRIALCGYIGETSMPRNWTCVPWKAHGGYGNRANGRGRANKHRERIWFSPHCLKRNGKSPKSVPSM